MNIDILWPVFALITLSFMIMPISAAARFRAVKKGKMKASQFRLMDLKEAPEAVLKTTRNWTNLYEVPVLFYALAGICLVLQWQDPSIIFLAWAYVGLRYAHSIIHITYNKVPHRFLAFFISNMVLLTIFIKLVLKASAVT